MKLVKLFLSTLLILNTFNGAPIFAEETTEIEETVEISETELDVVQTIEEVPEVEVLSEEVLPIEQVESEEVPVETEEPVEAETDLSEPTETTEEVSEEVNQSDIVEPTPTPTSEIDSEPVQENVEVESTPISTPEPTLEPTLEPTMLPEPTATPESEELETVSEVEVVEEAVEEEAPVNASEATLLKNPITYDDQPNVFYYFDNYVLDTHKNVSSDRYISSNDNSTRTTFVKFTISEEDLKQPEKFLRFAIKNNTNNNVEYDIRTPDDKWFAIKDNKNILSMFEPNDVDEYLQKLTVSGKYTLCIVTHGPGQVYFTLSTENDDYSDKPENATKITYDKTYSGKVSTFLDNDWFKLTAESPRVTISINSANPSEKNNLIYQVGNYDTVDVNDVYLPYEFPTERGERLVNLFLNDTRTIDVTEGKTYYIKVSDYGMHYNLNKNYTVKITKPKNLPKVKATAVYNSAHGADIRWKPIEGIQYYGIWRKRTNPVTKDVEEKLIYVADANHMTQVLTPTELSKENGKVAGLDENGNYRFVDKYLKDKYTDAGHQWQGGWVYYITARSTGDTSESYNDGKHLDIDGPISNKLNLYRLRNPEIKSVKANGNGKATITWTNVTNAFGYEVQYTLDNGKTWKKVPEVIAARWGANGREIKEPNYKASVTVSGLPKGKKVNFRIRCRKTNANLGDTWSEYSLWRSVNVK